MLDQLMNSTTLGPELKTAQRASEKAICICQRRHSEKQQLIPSILAQMTCSLRTTESHNQVYPRERGNHWARRAQRHVCFLRKEAPRTM